MPSFELTNRQQQANSLLGSPATHTMLYGGSRSGKTFLIIRALVTRALAHKSRHAVLRYRFNHLKGSVLYDTLPKVMELCFPGVADHCHLDKSDWFYTLPNQSEIWFGGLDEKERTEKILGAEYASIFLNECSQIPWASRNMAMTRLAQQTPLRLRAYYDCNPPSENHWTKRVFIDKIDPDTRQALKDPQNYTAMVMNPRDNEKNLPAEYIKELEDLPERMRRRFLLGQFGSAVSNALWTLEGLDSGRILDGVVPELQRIVIGVDPSGCAGPEDTRSDEVGIVVAGLGVDGRAYVLEDLSGRFGPHQWGQIVASAFDRHQADCVVGETNYGGAMVQEVIKVARPMTPFKAVTASRGKVVRAEPVAALYGTPEKVGKVSHVGIFARLEDQLCVVAGTLIETAHGQIPIERVVVGDLVMTRAGLAPVEISEQTGISEQIVRIEIGETVLECTPSHPIFVRDRFVSASNVRPMDSLLVSRRWESLGRQSHGADAGITGWSMGTFATPNGCSFTEQYTKHTLARSLLAFISTIRTKTLATIGSKISSVFPLPSTMFATSLADGTGIQITLGHRENIGTAGSLGNLPASSAGLAEKRSDRGQGSTVALSVRAVGCTSERRPVYNIKVKQGYLPEYFANGVLVHNCGFTTAGYAGDRSPDRADALVWALSELFPALARAPKKKLDLPPVNMNAPLESGLGWLR